MSSRSPLLVLFLLVAVAASGWLLLGGGDDAPDPQSDPAAVEPARPTPPAPPPTRTEPAPSEPPEAPSPDEPVMPPPVEAPPRILAPEQLKLSTVSFVNEPALNVVNDIARRAGFDVVIPPNVRSVLENAQVTLHLENTTGAMVLGLVLQPHQVAYSVRPNGAVRLFIDDD